MARKAKNPGIGRGKGGGRQKRTDEAVRHALSLTPAAAKALKEHCDKAGLSLGAGASELILAGLPLHSEKGAAKGAESVSVPPQPRPSWMLKDSTKW